VQVLDTSTQVPPPAHWKFAEPTNVGATLVTPAASPTVSAGRLPAQKPPQLTGPPGQVTTEGVQVLLISTQASGA
jgi:hypothetical protein